MSPSQLLCIKEIWITVWQEILEVNTIQKQRPCRVFLTTTFPKEEEAQVNIKNLLEWIDEGPTIQTQDQFKQKGDTFSYVWGPLIKMKNVMFEWMFVQLFSDSCWCKKPRTTIKNARVFQYELYPRTSDFRTLVYLCEFACIFITQYLMGCSLFRKCFLYTMCVYVNMKISNGVKWEKIIDRVIL